jgi:uncharacterized protein (TIGR02284 family)
MNTGIRKAVEVLNKLLKINNDRVEGYQKAAEETLELDLKTVFKSMADESKKNASALIHEIEKAGGNSVVSSTTIEGKVHHFWMDVKATFTGKRRKSILDSCEFGKDAQAAYNDAISSNELTTVARQMVRNQQVSLKAFYDIIRNFRDGHHLTYTKTF